MRNIYSLLLIVCSFLLWNVSLATAQIRVIEDGEQAIVFTGISADGQSVVGYAGDTDATLLWTETDELRYFFAEWGKSKGDAVSNNGVIVGQFSDPNVLFDIPWDEEGPLPIMSAGYLEDEEWHSLGILESCPPSDEYGGSLADGVSNDGTIIAGAVSKTFDILQPTLWRNGEMEALEYDERGQGARIQGLSGDGKVAAGWRAPYNTRLPVVWVNGKIKHINLNGIETAGECYKVSPNGKYVALTIDARAALYEIETEQLTVIERPEGCINAVGVDVSDEGIVVGYSQTSPWDPRIPFIYLPKHGMYNLNDYLTQLGYNANNADLASPMGISADGLRIVGFSSLRTGWIVDLKNHLEGGYYPPLNLKLEEVGAGTINIQWSAPKDDPDNTLSGYVIYRNGEKLISLPKEKTSHLDQSLPNGKYIYQVAAVWNTDKESKPTNEAWINTAKLGLPFTENFASNSLDLNYWNIAPGSDSRWLIGDAAGIEAPCVSYFNPIGSYSEAFTSPVIDASSANELYLSYNISRPTSIGDAFQDFLKLELYDGQSWLLLKTYTPNDNWDNSFKFEKINITDKAAGKEIRIRFTGYGTNSTEVLIWSLDNIRVFELKDDLVKAVPANFTAHKMADGTVRLNWADPGKVATLSYLEFENYIDFIGNEGKPLIGAIKYEPEDLTSYRGYRMVSVSALLSHVDHIDQLPTYNIVVYEGSERVYEQPIDFPLYNEWKVYELDEPYLIANDYQHPLHIGIEVASADPNDMPIGMSDRGFIDADLYPFEGRANLYSEDNGKTWRNLFEDSEKTIAGGVAIKGNLAKNDTSAPTDRLIGYMVFEEEDYLLVDPWSGAILYTKLHNYTVREPKANASCYQVLAFYDSQEISTMAEFCLGDDIVSIGTVDGKDDLFSIYPNPIEETLNISGEFTGYTLMNINGAVVLKSSENGLNVNNLPSGVYLLKIDSEGNKPVLKKIIKK